MFEEKPFLINHHSKIEAAYTESLKYLSDEPEVLKQIADHFNAYRQVGNVIPQTVENFGSGHFFPHAEFYYEFEASYEFALPGFYRYSFIALRLVLELGLLGVYFSVNGKEHLEVRPWITSKERTPQRKDIFKRLSKLTNFQVFDQKFQLQERIDYRLMKNLE